MILTLMGKMFVSLYAAEIKEKGFFLVRRWRKLLRMNLIASERIYQAFREGKLADILRRRNIN